MQNDSIGSVAGAYGGPAALAFLLTYLSLAAVGIVQDIRIRRIPNKLSLAILAGGCIFSVLANPILPGLRDALLGVFVGFCIWIAFYAIGVLGAGDVKYFAALSAWLGPSLAWRAALLSALIGGVLAIGFLIRASALSRTLRRLVLLPFLRSLQIVQVVDMNDDEARLQLPYGVAMGLGAILAFLFPNVLGTG